MSLCKRFKRALVFYYLKDIGWIGGLLRHPKPLFKKHVARFLNLLSIALAFGLSPAVFGEATPSATLSPLRVIDDTGQSITLTKPAQRVISLAPHTTELLYAAGGQSALAAAVAYSDYPAHALTLPRVGDYRALDIEHILAIKPDLIVAWMQPGTHRTQKALRKLNIPVFYSNPHSIQDIATTLQKLGTLLGTSPIAQTAALQFTTDLQALRSRYATRKPIRVFYQISNRPLITLNGQALINTLLENCGGINIFAAQQALAPIVSTEAMLTAKPDVIIISQSGAPNSTYTPSSTTTPKNNHYPPTFTINSDLLDRPGPRLAQGAKQLCEVLDFVRHTQLEADQK